ncbi:NADH:flavin oxidoreductase [Rhodococcus sp. T2V]|uniref:NADH:flavin oxidoreductase n=1 Tax=Rhodococcus sp. T2V TaxID=3034164 RepID=UPI0023E3143B|nr:NADH:flavin oxidoreductase [Rhodococcus sp. T2V]MDF3308141.1 NADH:flavin oxidoreductase [Rhodococcus sp. T2V]
MSDPQTDHAYSHLFDQLQMGPTTLPNRVALAPMTRVSGAEDGSATDTMAAYYEVFAAGGFGLVITEGLYTDTRFSQGYEYQPGLATAEHAASWTPVVDRIHAQGAKVVAQLMHAGAQSQGNRYTDVTVGPSAIAPKGSQLAMYRGDGPYPQPREITAEEIAEVRRGFVQSALLARDAGFDGIEIHSANGYLLDEFLTDYLNARTDEYGGSVTNRVRLIREILTEVRAAVGSTLTVGVRISQAKVSDPHHRWTGGEADAEIIFGEVAAAGVDYIHTTEYRALEPAFADSPRSLATLAKKYAGVAVIANGQLDEPADASTVLTTESADVVALGKPALANRDWPARVRAAQPLAKELHPSPLGPLADIKDWELQRQF